MHASAPGGWWQPRLATKLYRPTEGRDTQCNLLPQHYTRVLLYPPRAPRPPPGDLFCRCTGPHQRRQEERATPSHQGAWLDTSLPANRRCRGSRCPNAQQSRYRQCGCSAPPETSRYLSPQRSGRKAQLHSPHRGPSYPSRSSDGRMRRRTDDTRGQAWSSLRRPPHRSHQYGCPAPLVSSNCRRRNEEGAVRSPTPASRIPPQDVINPSPPIQG
jgi:hypothetical protein